MPIRPARLDDLPALGAIIDHHVLRSRATFDEEPWSEERRARWFAGFAPSGPHRLLLAEDAGRVLGWTSSGRYRDHPAFRETVETSIYLAADAQGRGLGSALYTALFAELEREPVHCAVAGIALPNPASVALHRKHGFREVGVFEEYALKRGERISSVWMQKRLRGL